MSRLSHAAVLAAVSLLAIGSPALAQTASDDARFDAAQRRFANEQSIFRAEFDRYQQARANFRGPGGYRDPQYDPRANDPRYSDERDEGGYDPARYYRSGPNYQDRPLASTDRVYGGSDGRAYCKRSDGTTGLIIGGAGGAVLGNVIDGGRSRTVGTLIGGALGALAGKSIDQNNSQLRCR